MRELPTVSKELHPQKMGNMTQNCPRKFEQKHSHRHFRNLFTMRICRHGYAHSWEKMHVSCCFGLTRRPGGGGNFPKMRIKDPPLILKEKRQPSPKLSREAPKLRAQSCLRFFVCHPHPGGNINSDPLLKSS